MELEIKEKLVELDFNLSNFKGMYKKELKLENAVKSNIKIIENENDITSDEVKRLLYFCFDWGKFLKEMDTINKNTIKFKLYNVCLKDFKKVIPFGVTEDQRTFTFKEEEFGEAIIIIQDGIVSPYFPIDNMLGNNIFDYGNKDYGLIVEVK